MTNKAWVLCAALAACGGNSGGGGGNCGGGGGGGVVLGGGGGGTTTGGGGGGGACTDAPGATAQYQTFTPRTRTVGDAIGSYQIAISDGTGGTACGLSSDKGNSLGVEGHEIIATLTSSGTSCAVGTYAFGSDCPADPGPEPAVPYHCAYYRLFDATGKSSGFLAATAGSVTVSGDYNACQFSVNLSFSGTQFNDTFTLYNSTGTMPWCTP
jgi:hypothetical protein